LLLLSPFSTNVKKNLFFYQERNKKNKKKEKNLTEKIFQIFYLEGGGVSNLEDFEGMGEMKRMKISGVGIDPKTNTPVVLLKNEEETLLLPIWVGIFEANSIAMGIEKVAPPRPLTHDLIKNILKTANIKCEKMVITEIKDDVFYAKLFFKTNSFTFAIDSRPSDAMAIVLRFNAPIYVEDKVLESAVELVKPLDEEEAKKLKEYLKTIKPEDFSHPEF
jgi:hypothetical protein